MSSLPREAGPSEERASPRAPRDGKTLDLRVSEIDARGRGIARAGTLRVAIDHAAPGALVRARVFRRRGGRAEGRVVEVLEPSPDAVAARCPHHGPCGGCSFQDLAYPAQLRALRALVERSLRRANLDAALVEDVVASPQVFHYRNKMDFTFGARRWVEEGEEENADASFALGLHVAGRYRKVLDVRTCSLHFEGADGILGSARELARAASLPPWDVEQHAGLLRHLLLRKGVRTGEILVALVTSEEAPERIGPYLAALCARHPAITTVVQLVHPGRAAVAMGERAIVHRGAGVIRERLGAIEYEISALSFFQTNTEQAETLVRVVSEEAALAPGDVAWDLYCGAGAIGLQLARSGARVYGVESVASAVDDARRNAARNGIDGATFVLGETERLLADEASAWPRPAACIVDPPRAGVHPRALAAIARVAPPRIVYVSCNVDAGARDVAGLCAAGFRLVRVRPLDLFPHTPHVECVFTLVASDSPR